MSLGSVPSIPGYDPNAGTRVLRLLRPDDDPWSFEHIFLHHYEALHAVLQAEQMPGGLVFAVHNNVKLTGHAHVGISEWGSPGTVMVIGRHEQAGLALLRDRGISLRHLLVRVTAGNDGEPHLRVGDLKTGRGFEVEGVGSCRAVASDGPLFIRIGGYALLFFPLNGKPRLWPEEGRRAWTMLPAARIFDRRDARILSDAIGPQGRRRLIDEDSSVTLLPALHQAERHPTSEPMPPDTCALLTVVQQNQESIFPLTRIQLERGVLLGRYTRCDIGANQMWQEEGVSRVHAVLLKEGKTVFAIDAASTNGTIVDGMLSPIAALGDESLIELGLGNIVRWDLLRR